MDWQILTLSLVVSIVLAFIFVKIIVVAGLKEQLNLIVPLLPIFYGLVFPALEKTLYKSKYTRFYQSPERWRSDLWVIAATAFVSIFTQMSMDAGAWMVNRHFVVSQPLPPIASVGAFHVVRLLQGSLLHLDGGAKLLYLSLQMLIVSIIGGICAGLLSRENPLLNGLLAGVIVSVWMGANQFSVLYEELTGISIRMTVFFGLNSRWSNGVMIGLFVQVFLFAIFSGIASRYQLAKSAFKFRYKKY